MALQKSIRDTIHPWYSYYTLLGQECQSDGNFIRGTIHPWGNKIRGESEVYFEEILKNTQSYPKNKKLLVDLTSLNQIFLI